MPPETTPKADCENCRMFNNLCSIHPQPDLPALLDDLDKLVEGRPDDTRAVLMRGELRTLLSLARKGIWAEEAKEALDRISDGEYPRNRMTVIARGALSSFPSIQ
jgi:hypothetical protein